MRHVSPTAVGFDLDGVIADIVGQLVDFARARFQIHLNRDQITSENVETCTPLTREILTKFFTDPTFFMTLKPVNGARRLLTLLRKSGNTVHIVTDRFWYPELNIDTRQWLNANSLPFDSLHFARKTEKQLIASKLRLEWFVEDQLSNANTLADHCHVLLLDQPYNRGKMKRNVQRVQSMVGIADAILQQQPEMRAGCKN